MIRRSMVAVGLGIGIWLVACSSSSSGGSGTPEGACDELVAAVCNKLNECAPAAIKVSYKDVNDCITRQKGSCVKSITAPNTGVTPAYASACASAFQSAPCGSDLNSIEACKTPAGTLADGQPCGDGAQCQNRACNKTGDATCGACAKRAAAGEDCTDVACDFGLRCAGNGKCVAPAKAGAACGDNQPCESPNVCSKGTCGSGATAGQSCANGEVCDSLKALFCLPTTKVCTEVKVANAGEACGFVDNGLVVCSAGGNCKVATGSTTGTCQAAAADGAACTTSKDGPNCQEPAECINGVCTISDPGTCK